VKAGDLLVRLRDEDFRAQVDQACGGSHRRERLDQQSTGKRTSGCPGAASGEQHQRGSGREDADVQRTSLERKRQEALVAAASATRQRLEQATADDERFRAQNASRESEIDAARAQLASRFSRRQE
jgi:membrane fusion protein (multidrug efflux system)